MSQENNFVAQDMDHIPVTPAQKRLIDLLNEREAAFYAKWLKEVHQLGTYFVSEKDLVNLEASLYTFWLYEAIIEIAVEFNSNLKQS